MTDSKGMLIALNIGLSAIATDHFFSALMSSPKSSEHFLKPEEVRQMFEIAAISSVVFAIVMSYLLENPWGLVTTLLMLLEFTWAYWTAMGL